MYLTQLDENDSHLHLEGINNPDKLGCPQDVDNSVDNPKTRCNAVNIFGWPYPTRTEKQRREGTLWLHLDPVDKSVAGVDK